MELEELTDERFLRLINIAACLNNLDIEALEKNEVPRTWTYDDSLIMFYVTRKGVPYSVTYSLSNAHSAGKARDVLEENGLDALLACLWEPYVDKVALDLDLTRRGFTPELWEDLFYVVSHQLVWFMWRSSHRNQPLDWSPLLICNDLWMLACADYSELPLEELRTVRKAHELFGWDGPAAWASEFNNRTPVERHTKREDYNRAQLWISRVKRYGLEEMIKRGTSDGQSERQTS